MPRKAAVPVPPRLVQDLQEADGRSTKQFLQNVFERINDLVARLEEAERKITALENQ